MKYTLGACTCIFLITNLLTAAAQDVAIQTQSNYNSWGTAWDSVYVLKNNIVTLAAVPKIGGRIMQYDLGTHASMYVDSANKGKVPAASALLGGFRTLASPQSSFPWPPSPVLEVGQYSCAIKANTADSGVIYLESKLENTSGYDSLDGLQFKRTITLYASSSHVKVQMTMANKGTKTLRHGIWDITECVCRNNNVPDTSNIWLYFPLNPTSTMGGGKGFAQLQGADASQWKPNTAPGGIMGVQYRRKEAKVGADSKAGWICYVDRLDGYAYVKRFTYETGKTYPDSGSSVEVYTSGSTTFLEEEVMGPVVSLAPNDSVGLVEDWYASRSKGPVLAVNNAGLLSKKLTIQQTHDTVKAQGVYGIFYEGTVKSIFKTAAGATVAVADSNTVSPLDSFAYNDTLKVPATAAVLALALYTVNGGFVGNLDSIAVAPSAIFEGAEAKRGTIIAPDFKIFAKGNGVSIRVPFEGNYSFELTDIKGRLVGTFKETKPLHYIISPAAIQPGVYLVRARFHGTAKCQRIILPCFL
jgi:hypothetical protein